METMDKKQQFIELRAQGLSYDKIAQKLEVSKQTLINWSKDFELMIRNLKAIALETLQEEFCATKEKRIRIIGETLKAMKEEFSKRDLAKLPTEKLLDFLIKYIQVLKDEAAEITFRQETTAIENILNQTKEWQA
jgi:DNA-binding XRE family transcriptional regulator